MLNKTTILQSYQYSNHHPGDQALLESVDGLLRVHGYCLLRGFPTNMPWFSDLIAQLCASVTFDPARQTSKKNIQKVDAGTAEIGLHIENGNTPNIPELVAFYSRQAARRGSATTLCDGVSLWRALDAESQQAFDQTIYVSRTLPEELWKSYLVAEHPLLNDSSEVTSAHLYQMLESFPDHRAVLGADQSLQYTMPISPVRISRMSNAKAFANAILGPSINYQIPVYKYADGTLLGDELVDRVRQTAADLIVEIPWQDGDIAILDNHRVMHGRRQVEDAGHRELFIAMGNL